MLGFGTEYLLPGHEQVDSKTCQRRQEVTFGAVLLREVACLAGFGRKGGAEWQEGKLPICVDYSN